MERLLPRVFEWFGEPLRRLEAEIVNADHDSTGCREVRGRRLQELVRSREFAKLPVETFARALWNQGSLSYQPAAAWLGYLEECLQLAYGLGLTDSVRECLRRDLRASDCFFEAMTEVHCVVSLARLPNAHVEARRKTPRQRTPDMRLKFDSESVNIEVTRRRDVFPLSRTGSDDPRVQVRETVEHPEQWGLEQQPEPHASRPNEYAPARASESQRLREMLRNEAAQLPANGLNLIVVNYLNGNRLSFEDALHGDTHGVFCLDPATQTRSAVVRNRVANGVFHEDGFQKVSAVIRLLLTDYWRTGIATRIVVEARAFPNPNAAKPIPKRLLSDIRRSLANTAVRGS